MCLCSVTVSVYFFSQMLTLNLSIYVSGLDQMDSGDLDDGLEVDFVSHKESGADVGQWEAELLEEILQELLHAADEDTDSQTQVGKGKEDLPSFLFMHFTHNA